MQTKRAGIGATVVAVLAGVGIFVGHEAGAFTKAVEHLPPIVRPASLPHPPLPAWHPDPKAIDAALQQADDTFSALREGSPTEREVVKAACAAVNAYSGQLDEHDEFEQAIDSMLPATLRTGGYARSLVAAPLGKATNTLTVLATQDPNLTRFYLQSCVGRR